MIKNSATYISKIILVAIFVTLSFSQKELYGAKETGTERIRECKDNGEVGDFDPVHSGEGINAKVGKEMDYNLSNPFCILNFAATYATIKLNVSSINAFCKSGPVFPRIAPSIVKDLAEIAKATQNLKIKECAAAFTFGLSAITGALTSIFPTHLEAKNHYKAVRVCGSDWRGSIPSENRMASDVTGSYSKEVSDCVRNPLECGGKNINDAEGGVDDFSRKYREWFYRGREFNDNPAEGDVCKDPSRGGLPQRYYLRGLSSNFMCEKYNPNYNNDRDGQYKKAYECCLARSQNYICLEKKDQIGPFPAEHVFCKGDSKCSFKNNIAVQFETYRRDNGRLICAKSYSLCPFNFAIGGGSPYPDYYLDVDKDKNPITQKMISDKNCINAESRGADCIDNGKLGKLKNYCQYFRHCTTTNSRPYVTDLEIQNPYYSKACLDFVGDSQNGVKKLEDAKTGVSYNGGLLYGRQANFSAPIVQCFKETIKNIFTNTAGHSRCMDGSFGNSANECRDLLGGETYASNGTFIWKKGNKVKENSLFEFLQKRLKMIITTVLVISITFLGFKILVGKLDLSNKKEILVYIIKIAFVVYFVNGTAWKDIFFDGIYNGSNEISRIFFQIRSSDSGSNLCNFGSQRNEDNTIKATPVIYPAGSEYLMVWDTLDCKIMQYLNYRPGFSASTIFFLIIAAFFTGGIGLIMALSVLIMAVCLIMAVIRAMHIFISSAIAIVIYVFISPIIIPLVLFEKTKSIFDSWLMQLMSFTLSPIVLFAYLAIFISLSEEIMYSGASGFKDGVVECDNYCKTPSGLKLAERECIANKGSGNSDIIDPLDYSVACLLNFNGFKKDNGFALFGIVLPSLGDLLADGKAELRIMLVLKSALFLFILAQFMDEIPSIIARLTGEVIDVKSAGYIAVMKKFASTVRGIQKRGARLVKGGGLAQLKNAKKGASEEKGEEKNSEGSGGSKGGGDLAGGSSGESGGGEKGGGDLAGGKS